MVFADISNCLYWLMVVNVVATPILIFHSLFFILFLILQVVDLDHYEQISSHILVLYL